MAHHSPPWIPSCIPSSFPYALWSDWHKCLLLHVRHSDQKAIFKHAQGKPDFFRCSTSGVPRYYMNYFIGNRVLNGVYRMHAFYANVRFWNNEHSEYGCRNKLESILRWKIKEQNRYGGIETFRGIKGIDCETKGRKIACSVFWPSITSALVPSGRL